MTKVAALVMPKNSLKTFEPRLITENLTKISDKRERESEKKTVETIELSGK